ncbi:class D sortase [Brevibacillus fluminis]|uniref:class D sortase n=1 Tax=Brevibacillus fluminis TaxID=511487 RepID=UPI003F88D0E2
MNRKIVSALLIAGGIAALAFPKLSEMYDDSQQQQLVKEWQESLQNIHSGDDASPQTQTQTQAHEALQEQTAVSPAGNSTASAPSEKEGMEGMLVIDKIQLRLPILHGATDQNMKTTVASIANTGKAGEVGNYAIAGHRSYTFGRNFNRLDEMAKGDKIEVDTGAQKFVYTVTEKLYVKPEDVWVLEGNGKDKEITLITCHPMVNPTHRLIVKGILTN